jgi:hypothetical protein
VLDTMLRAKPLPQWLERSIASMLGTNALGVLEFAVAMVLLIAIVGADVDAIQSADSAQRSGSSSIRMTKRPAMSCGAFSIAAR